MKLHLTKCILRPWRPSDAESLALHGNNINISRNLRDIFPHPYTLNDAEFFINKVANSSNQHIILAIETEDSAVGGIGAHLLNDVYKQNAEFGYWLGEKYHGRGIVTEALDALVKYVFENYDIKRAFACVFANNTASMRVLEKCGFKREAIHKNAVIKDGLVMDEYVYVKFN